MGHILICGAAGYTNLGDDAILWGMLTELRAALGGRAVSVAGGPALAPLVSAFDAVALSYDDRPELARAIEDADLVILGGGGLLYDVDYSPSIARLLTEPPDRQWLYELAKITAAARAAGRPVMLYGMGIGPLLTKPARQVARFIGEEARAVTVRDESSAELLAECGVSRSRIHVAADPAISIEPGGPAAQSILEQSGLRFAPRPLIALNLRPWFRFGGVDAGSRDAMQDLVSRSGDLVRLLRERLGATVGLLPLQRLNDDDREVLEQVLQAAGSPSGAMVLEPPASPLDLVTFLSQFDLLIGMRLHSLILAADAGIPFVALPYVQKVWDFVAAMGVREHAYAAEQFDVPAVASSCEALLKERDAAIARIVERRTAMREAAAISPEMARFILEESARPSRIAAAAVPAQPRELRVLMQIRPDFRERPGGDVVQLEAMLPYLRENGVVAEMTGETAPDLSGYDLVHIINLDRPEDPYRHCLNAFEQGKPVALSTVHTDLTEFLEWGDTDYWDLPEPARSDPTPRKARTPGPVELRRRALAHLQRQSLIDWATAYLPNAQVNAEYLARTFGMDLSRSVVVPNAAKEESFSATPDLFVEKRGLQDFVLCVGRVEKKKNQLSLIAALRSTGIPLVIVGQPNPESYLELCRRYAGDNVHFITSLSEAELASAYAAAKVHALASWIELPGLTSLEAAAAGCNIVSTDRGSPREYFGDMAWYCDPARVDTIREAVLAAYAAPRTGRLKERIRQRYTWEQAAQKTREGYLLAVALHEQRSDVQRQTDQLRATREHADWLARVVADREYEVQRLFSRCQELEGWARSTEKSLADQRRELEEITSRRLYRWSVSLAHAGWGVLRALGIKR
jgi:polysaccharide pyruvyl transferase WcaK-like protein